MCMYRHIYTCVYRWAGRKCLRCSGADKLWKIITLFVLVARVARHIYMLTTIATRAAAF